MEFLSRQVECAEIPFTGSSFTWRKKKGGDNNILERLDKGVASISWISKFPQAKIIHHPFTTSDHCIISLDYLPAQSIKAPPFRFEKMWCSRKDYDNLIKKTWCTKLYGSFMFCLMQKCRLLKAKTKIWNQTQFGNVFRQLRKVGQKLLTIQASLLLNQSDSHLQNQQELFLLKRDKLLSFSHEYWKQKK